MGSSVLPLRSLGHQVALYGAHLSPSLHTSAHNDTHLDSVTPRDYLAYISHSLWFLPQASLFLFHVCTLLVVILYYVVFIYLNSHSLNMLPDSQRTSLQNNASPEGSIRECFFCLFWR